MGDDGASDRALRCCRARSQVFQVEVHNAHANGAQQRGHEAGFALAGIIGRADRVTPSADELAAALAVGSWRRSA
jgi:hypothetical protein